MAEIPTQRRRVTVGDRYGRLVVIARAGTSTTSHALWECRCDCGAVRVVRGIHLGRRSRSCGCLKREQSTERGRAGLGRRIVAVPGSRAAHHRITVTRGRAADHPCTDCGEQARDWSYDWSDPHELTGEDGPYSLDADRYQPRCRACHKRYDLAHVKAAEGAR